MPFEVTEYRREDVDNLIDYLLRVSQTEHGLDGAVRQATTLAERIRAPRFRSIRGNAEKVVVQHSDITDAPPVKWFGQFSPAPVGKAEMLKIVDVAPSGRVLRRWNKVKKVFEFIARE